MPDLLLYSLAGGTVGFVVGMTGVGGGSFMTPILLAFGFPPPIAIGTDLLYASITKAGGVLTHHKQSTIHWGVVQKLALGSLPSSIITLWYLKKLQNSGIEYHHILTTTLGIMLVITSSVLLFRSLLLKERHQIAEHDSKVGEFERQHAGILTFLMGIALGVLVTLSSVGAGAFGAAVLMVLYPRMPMIRIIGTDLAHAIPLTAIAGLGHMQLGHVDFILLGSLLIGSLPAIWLGTKVANKLPERMMQYIMSLILMILGIRYAIY